MHKGVSIGASALLLAVLGWRDDSQSPTEPAVTNTAAAVSNTWITRTALWTNQYWGFATATLPNAAGQSIVYVIRGRWGPETGGSLSKVMAYNVATNRWNVRAPLPVPLQWANGAAVINGKIYVSGGQVSEYAYSHALYMYDPATNVWTKKRDMPTDGERGVSGVLNGKLYVLTGCYSEYCYSEHGALYRSNPLTDRWAVLATLREFRPGMVGGTIDGKFYVAGGTDLGLHMYDPATNQWTTKAFIPRSDYAFAGTTLRYMCSGGIYESQTRWTLVYAPSTNSWTAKARMPTFRDGIGASKIMINGKPRIEVIGGPHPGNNLQYIP